MQLLKFKLIIELNLRKTMESNSANQDESESVTEDDLFSIMISTDNHCGYKERDNVIGQDSFLAFEEVLENAIDYESDFLLLGGDLYHETTPSRLLGYEYIIKLELCINKVSKIINTYAFGEQNIQFETYKYPKANYLNKNFSVRLPIFMIHGNHDDPSGDCDISNIDFLSSTCQLNYFGKNKNIEKIEVKPILFHKGLTKIALYGIGNMKEVRLNMANDNDKIKYIRPQTE